MEVIVITEGHVDHVATEVPEDGEALPRGELVVSAVSKVAFGRLLAYWLASCQSWRPSPLWHSKSTTPKSMKALGMVILSHMQPLTSSPDSEAAALTMVAPSSSCGRTGVSHPGTVMNGVHDGRTSEGDGAQDRAHGRGHSMGDPGCRINGPDGLTPGQCEAAMWTWVPALLVTVRVMVPVCAWSPTKPALCCHYSCSHSPSSLPVTAYPLDLCFHQQLWPQPS